MFDTERFIAEIEKRPAIYDVNSEEYNDRNAKMFAWDQVCEVMIAKWRSLSDEEKNIEEKILRGKWRNIRDYFMKELKLQRLRKGSAVGRKRKKYMYFDQLLFLMPNVENRQNRNHQVDYASHCKNEDSEHEVDDPIFDQYEMPLTHDNASEDYPTNPVEDGAFKYITSSNFPKSICETSMASATEDMPDMPVTNNTINQRTKSEDDDYDRMFLLSLLPILRKIPEEKKLDVRIQMQQALALAMRNTPSNT